MWISEPPAYGARMLASRRPVRTAVVWSAVVLAGAVAVTAAAGPGLAHPQPYPLTRVNVSTGGAEAGAATRSGVGISGNGRYVVFASYADNLVLNRFPGPPPGVADIFIRDMTSGRTELVSLDSSGAPSAADSDTPTVSDDGDLIAFTTTAGLSPADTNGVSDVYLRTRSAGTTTLLSRDAAGAVGDAASSQPMISANGSLVVFASDATNLVAADTNGRRDIFVAEVATGSIDRVNIGWLGAEADEDSAEPAVSSDGRYVVFSSEATNLVPADTNGDDDVFLVDRDAGAIERVSVYNTNMFRPEEFDGPSGSPSVTSDGRYVVFETLADVTVSRDTNATWDVVRRDRLQGQVMLMSDDRNGRRTANGASRHPRISADGVVVTFESAAEDLDWESGNGYVDVFVWRGGSPVSMRWGFIDGNGASHRPAIDGTGSRIAFTSAADNLVSDDCNGVVDVLVSLRDVYLGEDRFQPCRPEPVPR
jgi:Tol biopolymer transport system component